MKAIYELTRRFPAEERYGLTAQLRRAVVSVPSNIAEGHARHGRREFAHFISNAQGSVAEVFTQVHIANHLGYCSAEEIRPLFEEIDHVSRMLNRLRCTLHNSSNLESRIPNLR